LQTRYYEFIDHFNFDREVVGVAINYVDHYTSINADSLDDDTYQTLAATALFLAIKLHATSCEVDNLHKVRKQALSKIIYGLANPKKIYEMEMSILRCLDWCVNPPTLHQFAFMFYKFHPLRDTCSELGSYIYEATRYQVELAIFMPELLANFKPSVIVYAAIKNAEEKISADNPHILTADMKQSLEASMPSNSGVIVDPTAVAQCQMLLKRVCPELPDLDYFSDTMTDTLCCNKSSRTDSNSPTNVVDFCA
jgi:hypothetical protein